MKGQVVFFFHPLSLYGSKRRKATSLHKRHPAFCSCPARSSSMLAGDPLTTVLFLQYAAASLQETPDPGPFSAISSSKFAGDPLINVLLLQDPAACLQETLWRKSFCIPGSYLIIPNSSDGRGGSYNTHNEVTQVFRNLSSKGHFYDNVRVVKNKVCLWFKCIMAL